MVQNLIAVALIALGATFALWPVPLRKISTFFDTLIHEAGHGLSSLPFGAPLPSITVRKNTSGETQSAMGYLHQFLPLGLGVLTEKIARFLSLMAGYSASLILAAFLLVLIPLREIHLEPWVLLLIAQIALATLLWTLVRVTESPLTFLAVAAGFTFIYLLLFSWNWLIYGGVILGAVVLFFLARSLLATLAVALTVTAPLVPIAELTVLQGTALGKLIEPLGLTVDIALFSRVLFGALLLFLALCCRSWLSFGLTALILGSVFGLLFVPGLPVAFVFAFVAGMLTVAGVRSLMELHRITFSATASHWQSERVATDMVFAAEEIGGDPRYWYWAQCFVAGVGFLGIVVFGYFL